MAPKKPSGAANRRKRNFQLQEKEKQKEFLKKYLAKPEAKELNNGEVEIADDNNNNQKFKILYFNSQSIS